MDCLDCEDRPATHRHLCNRCYGRRSRSGEPMPPRMTNRWIADAVELFDQLTRERQVRMDDACIGYAVDEELFAETDPPIRFSGLLKQLGRERAARDSF